MYDGGDEVNNEKIVGQIEKISNQLHLIIPEPWDKILLYSEVTEWSNRTFFYYFPHLSESPIYSLDLEEMAICDEDEVNLQLHQLYEDLRQLWNEFKNQKQQPWTNLTLELTSNGKFNVEYDYEDLSNEDSYKQQVIWEYENLGKMPNENRERDLTIIKKYTKASNSNDM